MFFKLWQVGIMRLGNNNFKIAFHGVFISNSKSEL